MSEAAERAPRTSSGAGRALVAVYGVFALAATARAGVQLATRFAEAPLAYLLSALAGVVYLVATVTLARGDRTSRRVDLFGHSRGLGRALAGLLRGTTDAEIAAVGGAGTGGLRVVG